MRSMAKYICIRGIAKVSEREKIDGDRQESYELILHARSLTTGRTALAPSENFLRDGPNEPQLAGALRRASPERSENIVTSSGSGRRSDQTSQQFECSRAYPVLSRPKGKTGSCPSSPPPQPRQQPGGERTRFRFSHSPRRPADPRHPKAGPLSNDRCRGHYPTTGPVRACIKFGCNRCNRCNGCNTSLKMADFFCGFRSIRRRCTFSTYVVGRCNSGGRA